MFAQVSNLKVGELVHVIADAHIYDRHVEIIKEMINREERPAAQLSINSSIKDFYKFTVNDFILTDYDPHPQFKNIPVAE